MNKPLPLSFYLRVSAPRMFVMQVLAPSVNRLIAVDDPGCSPVGNGVPWYVGLSDYGSLRLRRRLAKLVAASLSYGKQKLRLWPQFKTQPGCWA